jgi:uncharacterized protein with PQ loop repeat
MNPFVEAIGVLGGGLGFLISIPQLIRVIKTKSHTGVSLSTWMFITMSTFGWTAYGYRFHSFSQITTNTVAAILAVILTFILLRFRFTAVAAIGILATVAVPTYLVVSYAPILVMNVCLYIALWSRVPQTWTSFQSMRAGSATVVSISTYVLSAISSFLWVIYGTLAGLDTVVYFSIVIIIFSVLVTIFELIARRRAGMAPTAS